VLGALPVSLTSMPAEQEPLELGTGQALLMALFSTVRRMRGTGSSEAIDLGSIYVLQMVMINPGIRVSELAGNLGLDASTVSRHVQALEQSGYLKRKPDPKDKRASCVQLTDDGLGVIVSAFRARAAMIMEAMRKWSVEDRTLFTELAVRFAADFERAVQD
jgi:DNA-binding MarR family transcriptional regulator